MTTPSSAGSSLFSDLPPATVTATESEQRVEVSNDPFAVTTDPEPAPHPVFIDQS